MKHIHPLTVLSFNIRYDAPNDAPYSWARRKHHALQLMQFHRPDILALQEVLPQQMADLRDALTDYQWVYFPRRGDDEGCPIGFRLDRLSVLESGKYWLSETPDGESTGWDAALPRIATWALLERVDDGPRFFLVSLHLDHKGAESRRRSMELVVARTVRQARDASLPVVIAGDFNCTSESEAFLPLLTAGMVDARAVATEAILGPAETCPGSSFLAGTRPGARIDYIMVSPNISVRRFATVTDHLYGVHPSDHFPIWAELQI